MSNLLVQNIKHTNNTTAITVDSSAQMTVKSDGGATTTSLQQGLSKAWVHFNKQSDPEKQDGFNISSLNDTNTGKTTVNVTNNFSNNDYACVMYQNGATGTGTGDFANHFLGGLLSRATGSVACVAYAASAVVYAGLNDVTFHGDLA